jgi:hypothetical protein
MLLLKLLLVLLLGGRPKRINDIEKPGGPQRKDCELQDAY